MMMTEQVQPRLHRGEDFVDLRLSCVRAAAAGKRTERLRGFVAEEDVNPAEGFASLHLFAHEVPAFVCQLGRLRAPLFRMREVRRRSLVPRRSERAPEAGNRQDPASPIDGDADCTAVRNISETVGQVAGGDRVDVVIVAVNPVDTGAQRLVTAVFVGDVANAEPEGNVGVRRDDRPRRVEGAVDVSERAYLGDAGTSSSVLSQMKSLLL